jgi:glycosyltransferase involved in cell wall biosynthesis
MEATLDISVVVPLYNEEESLPELMAWIHRVMQAEGLNYEVIMVDDGSKDSSWKTIQHLQSQYPSLRGFSFRRNYGKSAALNVGFEACRGQVVVTMDADLQDSPDELPALYSKIKNEGFDLISGWKKKRYDPLSKTIPTKVFNWATRKLSGIHLHDFNCGLKAYRYEVVKSIEVYGEMHRYIPVLAKWAGFTNIAEQVVQHQARKYGTTKFGLERFINGFLDLLSITFVSRFSKKPMHFFGLLGLVMFTLGGFLALWLVSEKLVSTFVLDQRAPLVTQNPLFYVGLLSMILGTQFFLAGFIAELVSRNAPDRNRYHIKDQTDV